MATLAACFVCARAIADKPGIGILMKGDSQPAVAVGDCDWENHGDA